LWLERHCSMLGQSWGIEMAYTNPITKTAASRGLSQTDWNTYIKANLAGINDHLVATSAVHGLPSGVYPIGDSNAAGQFLQTIKLTGVDLPNNAGWKYYTYEWTYTIPYTATPKIFVEAVVGGWPTSNPQIPNIQKHCTALSATGATFGFHHENQYTGCDVYACVIGPVSVAAKTLLTWHPPRTWTDGEIPTYSWWNDEVRDNVWYLRSRHTEMTRFVHGGGTAAYLAGSSTDGDQMYCQKVDGETKTFTRAFSAKPACVVKLGDGIKDPSTTIVKIPTTDGDESVNDEILAIGAE
jgi:hypothetical protein